MYQKLHQCQLTDPTEICSYLLLVGANDAIVFYGDSQLGLTDALIKRIQQKTTHMYALQENDLSIQPIDHSYWAELIVQSKTVFSWK